MGACLRLGFKGGKGVATALAVFLVITPKVGLISCLIWLSTLALFRISAVSALVAFVSAPIVSYFVTYDLRIIMAFSFISLLVIIRHHSNIKQLVSGRF